MHELPAAQLQHIIDKIELVTYETLHAIIRETNAVRYNHNVIFEARRFRFANLYGFLDIFECPDVTRAKWNGTSEQTLDLALSQKNIELLNTVIADGDQAGLSIAYLISKRLSGIRFLHITNLLQHVEPEILFRLTRDNDSIALQMLKNLKEESSSYFTSNNFALARAMPAATLNAIHGTGESVLLYMVIYAIEVFTDNDLDISNNIAAETLNQICKIDNQEVSAICMMLVDFDQAHLEHGLRIVSAHNYSLAAKISRAALIYEYKCRRGEVYILHILSAKEQGLKILAARDFYLASMIDLDSIIYSNYSEELGIYPAKLGENLLKSAIGLEILAANNYRLSNALSITDLLKIAGGYMDHEDAEIAVIAEYSNILPTLCTTEKYKRILMGDLFSVPHFKEKSLRLLFDNDCYPSKFVLSFEAVRADVALLLATDSFQIARLLLPAINAKPRKDAFRGGDLEDLPVTPEEAENLSVLQVQKKLRVDCADSDILMHLLHEIILVNKKINSVSKITSYARHTVVTLMALDLKAQDTMTQATSFTYIKDGLSDVILECLHTQYDLLHSTQQHDHYTKFLADLVSYMFENVNQKLFKQIRPILSLLSIALDVAGDDADAIMEPLFDRYAEIQSQYEQRSTSPLTFRKPKILKDESRQSQANAEEEETVAVIGRNSKEMRLGARPL